MTLLSIFNMSPNFTQNDSLSQEICEISADSFFLQIFKLIFLSIILICSLVGNVLIIIVVRMRQELRRTINVFIVNMAVSDLIFPLVSIPFSLAGIAANSLQWPIGGIPGLITCKLSIFLVAVSLTVSVQSLFWISLDRFVAVVLPLKAHLISSRSRAFAVTSTWILAVIINSTDLYITSLHEFGSKFYCLRKSRSSLLLKTIGYGRVALLSIAPLLAITVLYSAIAVTLRRQNKTLRCTAGKEHSQGKSNAVRMSLCIIVTFNLCALVYTVMSVAGLQGEVPMSCFVYDVSWFLAFLGIYLSSVVNPFICFTFVENYRRGIREIFTSRRDERRSKNPRNVKTREVEVITLQMTEPRTVENRSK